MSSGDLDTDVEAASRAFVRAGKAHDASLLHLLQLNAGSPGFLEAAQAHRDAFNAVVRATAEYASLGAIQGARDQAAADG